MSSMENAGLDFPGLGHDGSEDLTGSSKVPLSFSYTPFSVQIPNDYSKASHHWPLQDQPRAEQKRACPSGWRHDFNTHGFSCPLCFDMSDSGVSLCAPECYSGMYNEFLNPTIASHTWTPGDDIQYHTASVQPKFCPLPLDEVTAEQQKNSIRFFSDKLKKPCHCTKSQCLKLYCDCFANGELCNGCSCVNCFNDAEHAADRNKAIKTCLGRNPDAFRSKINSSLLGDLKGSHTRGCHCKSSGCLKNYCECYKAQIMCSSMCKCVGCSNYSRSELEKTFTHPDYNNTHSRANVSCLTDTVVAATSGCLLVQAEEMMKSGVCGVQVERATLEEFGYCLSQIAHYMFKHTYTLRCGLEMQSFLTVGIYRTESPGVRDGDKNSSSSSSRTPRTSLRFTGTTRCHVCSFYGRARC